MYCIWALRSVHYILCIALYVLNFINFIRCIIVFGSIYWILCTVFILCVLHMHCALPIHFVLCITFTVLHSMHCIICVWFLELHSMHSILYIGSNVLHSMYSVHSIASNAFYYKKCNLCIGLYVLNYVHCSLSFLVNFCALCIAFNALHPLDWNLCI